MDDADRAQAESDRALQSAIERVRIKPRTLPYTSYCWNCGLRIQSPRRWCDIDCRDDWERREHARARS